jgi:glutamate formiminotransferase
MPLLLAVPNVSEGDENRLRPLAEAFSQGVTLLDRHSDADHGRTVFTLAGEGEALVEALAAGATAALAAIEMDAYRGAHPAIGALDVCPLVWTAPGDEEAAAARAREVGRRLGDLGVPVFLYGALATDPGRAERAYFRNGGPTELWLRMESGELAPDFGPAAPHRTGGATLVTARPPLAAFNVELDSDDPELAGAVAAELREAGGGLRGVRAMGLLLSNGRAQVSTNVHDPLRVPLGEVVERVRRLAEPLGARPVEAELVGLIPAAALTGYPEDVPMRGFDPALHVIERRLEAATD